MESVAVKENGTVWVRSVITLVAGSFTKTFFGVSHYACWVWR